MFVGAFFVSAGFGLDADSGVRKPLGFAGAGFGANLVFLLVLHQVPHRTAWYSVLHVFNGTGEHTKAAEAFLASHTCQCILLDRKTCPVCGKKCHHDTPNRVKVMAGPV